VYPAPTICSKCGIDYQDRLIEFMVAGVKRKAK
jgi:hypothetical protein